MALLTLTLLSALNSVQVSALPGPFAFWRFDETSGTTATDSSGNNHTATLANGATFAAGHTNHAVNFGGADGYVNLGALGLSGSASVSMWLKADAISDDRRLLGQLSGATTQSGSLSIAPNNAPAGSLWVWDGSAWRELAPPNSIPLSEWIHLTVTFSAGTATAYLNGSLVGSQPANFDFNTGDAGLGARFLNQFGYGFVGLIDEVLVYSQALTAAEANELHSNGPVDPDFPIVAITSPDNNTQVSGLVQIQANATDDEGVAGVQFFDNGVAIGEEDLTAPYGVDWNTSLLDGTHRLTARARDFDGHTTTSSEISVTVLNPTYFQDEVILYGGIDLPTSMKFLPDGRMLIAELGGKIKILQPGAASVDPEPFLELTNVGSAGAEEGIVDFVLDPAFETNRYFYVFYTAGTPTRDRVARFTANESTTAVVPGSELVVYQDPNGPAFPGETEHRGGALSFHNDGKLYISTGDHFEPQTAQDPTSPRGKILRINPDGTVPTDNPFFDGAGPNFDAVWALGLRNPYRTHYDPLTGRYYIGDVGQDTIEEINLGVAGANYGWPDHEGNCSLPCTGPLYSYDHGGRDASITGGFVYQGTHFPIQYRGAYFFADYAQNWIKGVTFDANGDVAAAFNFLPSDGSTDGPHGDIVYLTEGPDGALYYVDIGISAQWVVGVPKIKRIRYTGTDRAPVAVAQSDVTDGPAPLTVNFSSAGSIDPDGQPITYLWNFGDNTTSTEQNPTHVYGANGRFNARLTVFDGISSSSSIPITVTVGSSPTATIQSPMDQGFFVAGDVINFSGDGTDPEDGPLPASAFSWTIDFLHDGHVHPDDSFTGITAGSFTIPTEGHDFEGNTRFRITLQVTDSTGLSSATSVVVYPRKVNLSFDTAPSGQTVYLDGIAKATPFVHETLVNFNHTIEARNNTAYEFVSWSDGGAQLHTVSVPSTDQSYVATYDAIQPTVVPIAFWRFDEASGTSAADASGNNRTATLVNGASFASGGTNGNAVQMDGVNDYVNLGTLGLTGNGTLSMWMRAASQFGRSAAAGPAYGRANPGGRAGDRSQRRRRRIALGVGWRELAATRARQCHPGQHLGPPHGHLCGRDRDGVCERGGGRQSERDVLVCDSECRTGRKVPQSVRTTRLRVCWTTCGSIARP